MWMRLKMIIPIRIAFLVLFISIHLRRFATPWPAVRHWKGLDSRLRTQRASGDGNDRGDEITTPHEMRPVMTEMLKSGQYV